MRLSRAGDYGLRVVLELAVREPDAVVSAREISERQEVPPAFLAKLVAMLTNAGILETRRGASGGASLARDPAAITVLDVVEAIEGPIMLNQCLLEPGACDMQRTCAIHEVWAEAQLHMRDVLSKSDFAQLARRSRQMKSGPTYT